MRRTIRPRSNQAIAKSHIKWPLILITLIFAVVGSIFLYRSFAANANLQGDVNNDAVVNLTDLSIVLGKWNSADATSDINGDGKVGLADLSLLLSNWNKTYTPPATPPTPPTSNPNDSTFVGPLKVSSNGHYFVDQNNKPFLYVADTIWPLFTLSENDAKQFIDLRSSQGFTVIQSPLPNYDRTGFDNGNMTTPNAAYIAKADAIIAYAATKNIVIYFGTMWGGQNLSTQDANTYGTWLGNHFKSAKNLLWFVGGDSSPDNAFETNKNIGTALKAANPAALISYHMWGLSTPWHLNSQPWYGYFSYQWNGLHSPYTYQTATDGYRQNPIKPYLDVEPAYEPNNADGGQTSRLNVRQNAWWSLLAGAAGVTYGGPQSLWNASSFAGADKNRPAALQTSYVPKIIRQTAWEKLVPDGNHQAVTGGYGSYGNTDYVTAGLASDGSAIVAYLPNNRTITVDLSKLNSDGTAQWYDPTTGSTSGSATAVTNSGSRQFAPPGNNAGGNSDWVLVVKAQ